MIFIDTDLAINVLSGQKTEKNTKAKKIMKILFEKYDNIYLTIFNKAELIRGAYISSNVAKNLRIIDEFVQRFELVIFDENSLQEYSRIYADLKKKGENIGDFDELIASIVYSHDGILYTHNVDHFQRISLMKIMDWMNL